MSKRHKCPIEGCGSLFARPSKLEVHIRSHTGARPFKCKVPDCNKAYVSDSHLRRHTAVSHTDVRKTILCPYEGCFRELVSQDTLKKHISRMHNPDRVWPFTCKFCKKGFRKEVRLTEHTYIHTGETPFKCDSCKLKFTSASQYKKHLGNHRLYSCECGAEFDRWHKVLEHKKTCGVGEKSKTCDVCLKEFASIPILKEHLKVHDTTKTYFECPVDDCRREYLHKRNLKQHIKRAHLNMKKEKIPCTHPGCDKLLSKRQSLKLHLKQHEDKPKVKKPRATRKDKGSLNKSTALYLSGLKAPLEVNRAIIGGELVEFCLSDEEFSDATCFSDCTWFSDELDETK